MSDDQVKELRNEINKLSISITKIGTKMDTEYPSYLVTINNIHKIMERHDEILLGNGQPGLKQDVAMLKKSEEDRRITTRALWGAIITLIGNVVYEIVTK